MKQHFTVVGLDPGFTVMDPDEAGLLRRDMAAELFERHYENEDGRFHALIDGYGQGNDLQVSQAMLRVHDLLTSVADPAAWIARCRQRIVEAIEGPLEQSELGARMSAIVISGLQAVRVQCDDAERKISRLGVVAYAEYVKGMGQIVRHWIDVLAGSGLDALAGEMKALEFPRLPSIPKANPGKELAKEILEAVRFEVQKGSWRKLLKFSPREWRDTLGRVRPHADLFLELVQEFGTVYQQAKAAARAVDFADLERLALRALCEPKAQSPKPSPVARAYHRRFAHVLVDEYQDINEVQDQILSLVSRECLAATDTPTNLFCVGDVKQSIYRFRLAEPARFLKKQSLYRLGNSHGRVIDLQANFRGRAKLLDALNVIFNSVMTADAVDIEYDQSHLLRGLLNYPVTTDSRAFSGAPIELHLLPKDLAGSHQDDDGDEVEELDRTEREAIFVSHEILRIVGKAPDGGAGRLVMEKDAAGQLARGRHNSVTS